jgi:hypothetical protein
MATKLPPNLSEISAGRDHINTCEFATVFDKSRQTIRKNYCIQGHCYGIRPIKVGNALLWPVESIAVLLKEGGRK